MGVEGPIPNSRGVTQLQIKAGTMVSDAEGRDADGNYGEHGLTPMRRIEAPYRGQLEHGELVPDTEKFALKGADRFKEKLAERINLQPISQPNDSGVSRFMMAIRYTFSYDE